jgi:hypothetical protein
MRTKIFLILLTGLLISCNNDDDISANNNPIAGAWKLIDVSCECAPPNFQANHTWLFDLSENKLIVDNETDEPLQIFDTGIYYFALGGNTITLLDTPYEYFFEDGKLFIGYEYHSD